MFVDDFRKDFIRWHDEFMCGVGSHLIEFDGHDSIGPQQTELVHHVLDSFRILACKQRTEVHDLSPWVQHRATQTSTTSCCGHRRHTNLGHPIFLHNFCFVVREEDSSQIAIGICRRHKEWAVSAPKVQGFDDTVTCLHRCGVGCPNRFQSDPSG